MTAAEERKARTEAVRAALAASDGPARKTRSEKDPAGFFADVTRQIIRAGRKLDD